MDLLEGGCADELRDYYLREHWELGLEREDTKIPASDKTNRDFQIEDDENTRAKSG